MARAFSDKRWPFITLASDPQCCDYSQEIFEVKSGKVGGLTEMNGEETGQRVPPLNRPRLRADARSEEQQLLCAAYAMVDLTCFSSS